MIHAGIGETQLKNLLAAMNVHCPHHKSLKSRENEVGDIIECQANASERKFLLDEAFQSMTIDAEGNEQAGINASTDTCWQKKGSGRAYNSLSGVASLIGEKQGKLCITPSEYPAAVYVGMHKRREDHLYHTIVKKTGQGQQRAWNQTW
ncbi:uncharacterized protein LOC127718721 [Mytilus californianus]|uniref:uncharacterized protein LOC127718721 n=1 Tax=Mytilus californianus TaxID=6549 RepID=UPI002246F0AE|nr:uncharacterized protein LOC127718721 [Mytilus californianus]